MIDSEALDAVPAQTTALAAADDRFIDSPSCDNAKAQPGSGGLTFALQALLARHEFYITDSEAERERLSTQIDRLSTDNTKLQSENKSVVEENRELLAQLEALNTKLGDSDAVIKSMEATLADAEFEVRRLTSLASKAEDLEAHLVELEAFRAKQSDDLEASYEREKSAIGRWHDADSRIRELSADLERLESEALIERHRYDDIVSRMDRERMLGSAEGRLKGAAAMTDLSEKGSKSSTGVVNHFVRDILMDNANLQAGLVELKEMLESSHEEVQTLRDQIIMHQPLSVGDSLPLHEKILWIEPKPPTSQAVHVHHHYHAKISTRIVHLRAADECLRNDFSMDMLARLQSLLYLPPRPFDHDDMHRCPCLRLQSSARSPCCGRSERLFSQIPP